jgi:orotate phosphoribosyltransferase
VADSTHGRPLNGMNLFGQDRVRLSKAQALAELRDDIRRAAYQPGHVKLDSGVSQPYFIDKYLMVAKPAILRRLSRFLAGMIPSEVERIAAPTLGAVALGTAVSLEAGLPLAIVRSHWDDSRPGHPVEGGIWRGETVVMIEDVVVTGSRALRAVERLRESGARVDTVVCVLDCERGAAELLSSKGVQLSSLFRYSSFTSSRETS